MADTRFMPELQGLRAVAVLLVFVFHLNAHWLSGGYVGVDAFFVLSGYFITGSLVAEIERSGRIRFLDFYERRFRRLLPAAALVLVAIMLGIVAYPRDQWPHIAREVAAAAVYVENLLLAHHSVDYLAFDRAASPVQHYWSLSVEEQFYLIWPLFLFGAVAVGRALKWHMRTILVVAIAAAFLVSLAMSVAAARSPQPSHYFLTHLRVWELALGGLVASLPARALRFAGGRVAPVLHGLGLAMLIGASIFYSATTVFPGSAALVPTFGTALILVVATQARSGFRNPMLDNPLLRWIGDISYSVYLWHWPIVVAVKDHQGGTVGPVETVAIIALVLGLAHLTKTQVEDRFRVGGGTSSRPSAWPRWWILPRLALAVAVPLVSAGAVLGYVAYDLHRFRATALDPRDYPGAAILSANHPAGLPARPFFPAAHLVPDDIPDVYANGCSLPFGASAIKACPAGAVPSPTSIAVVGDSHAAQWLPAFAAAGARDGWKIVPLTKSSCPLVATRLIHHDADSCADWAQNVLRQLRAHPPSMIVYSLFLDGEIGQLPSDAARVAAVRPMLEELAGLGSRVVVLRDTPHLAADPIAALDDKSAQPRPLPRRSRGAAQDIVTRIAAGLPGVTILDLDDLICPQGQCRTVIGNIVVWRDEHHITAHYAASLAPALSDRLERILRRPSSDDNPQELIAKKSGKNI